MHICFCTSMIFSKLLSFLADILKKLWKNNTAAKHDFSNFSVTWLWKNVLNFGHLVSFVFWAAKPKPPKKKKKEEKKKPKKEMKGKYYPSNLQTQTF